MKSIIDRETLKSMVDDPNIDTKLYTEALELFKNAKAEYKEAKVAYNSIKKQKLMRMNPDAFRTLMSLYSVMRRARDKYYSAKRDLNIIAVDTFTHSAVLTLNRMELGELVTKLVDLYNDHDWKDNELIDLTIRTDKKGRVL